MMDITCIGLTSAFFSKGPWRAVQALKGSQGETMSTRYHGCRAHRAKLRFGRLGHGRAVAARTRTGLSRRFGDRNFWVDLVRSRRRLQCRPHVREPQSGFAHGEHHVFARESGYLRSSSAIFW